MKKSILFLACCAVFSLVSCDKERNTAQGTDPAAKTITVTASLEDATKASAASPDADGKCKGTWDTGDQIAVHTKNGRLVILTTTTGGVSATFTGTVPDDDDILDNAVAYYPASSAIEGNPYQITLPTGYSSIREAAKGIPLRANIKTGSDAVTFNHLGAILVFRVNDIPSAATEIYFTAKGCAGAMSVAGGQIAKGNGNVTIAVSLEGADKESAEIALPLPTGTYEGFSISFNDGSSKPITSEKTFTLFRGQYAVMQENTESPVSYNYGVTGSFQSWDPAARVIMSKVPGYDDWYVAPGITLAGGTGADDGFKICTSDTWDGVSYGASTDSAQPLYTYIPAGANNVKVAAGGTYDIYFNAAEGKEKTIILRSGDPVVKTVYVLLEYVPGTDFGSNPNLHIWGAEGQGDVTTWDSSDFVFQDGTAVIDGIEFRKFPVKILENKTNFWKGGKYRLQYYLTPQGSRLFELREDKGTERGTHNFSNEIADVSFFVRAGLYATGIEAFTSADAIPSLINISGTFNDWPEDEMGLQGVWKGSGILWKDVAVPAGEARWKFRTYPVWGHQNICTSTSDFVVPGEEYELIHGGANDIRINVPEDGNYDFFLDMTTLKLLVTKSNNN